MRHIFNDNIFTNIYLIVHVLAALLYGLITAITNRVPETRSVIEFLLDYLAYRTRRDSFVRDS